MKILGFTCLRDDGPYIVEWVAHHLALGFDHLVIFSHDCTDGSAEILDRLEQLGHVTHAPFELHGKKTPQWQALKHARAHPRIQEADWVLFFDCDEFLWLNSRYETLHDLIADFAARDEAQCNTILIPWQFFGFSGQLEWKPGLTPERFQLAAHRDLHFPFAHLFKALVRPNVVRQFGVHRPQFKKHVPPVWRFGNGQIAPAKILENPRLLSHYWWMTPEPLIGINHYSLRSGQEFMIKRTRGLPNHRSRSVDLEYWVERNYNHIKENRIDRHLPATRSLCAKLFADEALKSLHDDACSHHKEKFRVLMEDVKQVQFFWHIGLAANSVAPSKGFLNWFMSQQAYASQIKRDQES